MTALIRDIYRKENGYFSLTLASKTMMSFKLALLVHYKNKK